MNLSDLNITLSNGEYSIQSPIFAIKSIIWLSVVIKGSIYGFLNRMQSINKEYIEGKSMYLVFMIDLIWLLTGSLKR